MDPVLVPLPGGRAAPAHIVTGVGDEGGGREGGVHPKGG